jgi:hypothetical protein
MRQRKYTDLDLDLSLHPESKDVSKLRDSSAIIRAIRNLVYTTYYDAPFQPTKGNFVAGALFENNIPQVNSFIENEIKTMISTYDIRVNDLKVRTYSFDEGKGNNVSYGTNQNNSIRVDIAFTPVGEIYSVDFNIILERTR